MPYCTVAPRALRPKLKPVDYRPKKVGYVKELSPDSKSVMEGKSEAGRARRRVLNPVKMGLNINERPVRKKKKTPKYETYERDRGVIPRDLIPHVETNVLLALGLRPVPNG